MKKPAQLQQRIADMDERLGSLEKTVFVLINHLRKTLGKKKAQELLDLLEKNP
jgi:hypothetical protein